MDSSNCVNVSTSMSAQNLFCLNLAKKGMNMGHLNIQGLQNKLDQLQLMLNSEENDIHLLGISESFHLDNAFIANNYQLFRKDRVLTQERQEKGGGLLVFVKDRIKYERRKDLETDEVECLFLEIMLKNSKSFLVGNLYRNPKETVQWNENFENLMEKALCEEKEIYILGDFNCDLLNTKIKKPWLEFMGAIWPFSKSFTAYSGNEQY